jgi:glutathione peroxidase
MLASSNGETLMSIHDVKVASIDGDEKSLGEFQGKALLIVNVASKCGLTPQYEGLQKLYDTYKDRGLEVLGFPCNQFAGQEPGTNDEIKEFCSLNFGVSFPLFDKIDVNGEARHPLYAQLTETKDAEGNAGDVLWNFEKFLVTPGGEVAARFRPGVQPDAPELVGAVEAQLPS